MSGPSRPQAPRISTNVNPGSASGSRHSPYANSPTYARHPAGSSAHSDAMNPRKRPAESRSRGNSPPGKRTRPPERSFSMHDRYANDISPSLSRSFPSKTGSLAGLPDNMPTGPRQTQDGSRVDLNRTGISSDASDRRRPNGATRPLDEQQRRSSAVHSPLHVQSPSSGSGASTPNHRAPRAPSMLPTVGSTLAGTAGASHQHQGQVPVHGTPISLASLQKLRLRKQAIANEAKNKAGDSVSSAPLNAQLKAQQIEIAHLKKERENMSAKLKALEGLPNQIQELKSELEQTRPSSEALQHFEIRVAKLENTQPLQGRLEALETTTTQYAASLDKSTKLEQLIEQFMSFKAQQPARSEIEEMVRASAPSTLTSKMKNTETQLNQRIEEQRQTLVTLSKGLDVLEGFRKNLESKAYDDQLHALSQKIQDIESNEARTYKKVSGLADNIGPVADKYDVHHATLVDRLNKLGKDVGQVKNFQSEQSKLAHEHKQLTARQDTLSKSQEQRLADYKKLTTRVVALEQKPSTSGPTSKKVGTTVAGPSANNNHASVEVATQRLNQVEKDIKELRQSSAGLETLSSRLAQVDERTKIVDEHGEKIKAVEALCNNFTDKWSDVESRLSALNKIEELDRSLAELSAKLSEVETQKQGTSTQSSGLSDELARLSAQVSELNENIESQDNALDEIDKKVHGHSSRLDVMETGVPVIIKATFDPFKEDLEGKIKAFGQSLGKIDEDIANLQQRTQPPANAPDSGSLRQELTRLETAVAHETTARQYAIQGVQRELASKASKTDTEQQMDRFTLSFRNLQDQYNNITTDDLHGRMVHWFLQNYPSNTANMLQQVASLRQDVDTLKDISAQVSWIQSRSSDLSTLLAAAPKLQALMNSESGAFLPQTLARIDEACDNAKQAILVAEAAKSTANGQRERISSVQQSLHNLNSASSHIATNQTTQALEHSLLELQKEVEAGFANARVACANAISEECRDRADAINELRTAATHEHEMWIKETERLESSVTACTTAHEQFSTSLTHLLKTSEALRRDVDTINNDYIGPNRDLFGLFSSVLIVVGQLQSLLESINQNLPNAPIAIEWHMDLNDLDRGGSGSSNDKGRSKR